jgi:hypothetical protein
VLVGVFVAETAAGVRVAVTDSGASGVFPEMEKALAANFAPEALKGITVDPSGLVSDLRGSAEYRAALIPIIAERAVAAARVSRQAPRNERPARLPVGQPALAAGPALPGAARPQWDLPLLEKAESLTGCCLRPRGARTGCINPEPNRIACTG